MEPETIQTPSIADICEAVIKGNDHGKHTVPSPSVYAHQWLWDSAFAAIGWSHIDTKRAQQEVFSLLHGQWHNGMIPHMIFDPAPRYTGDRNFWNSKLSRKSPDHVATSGITQPPLIAEAVQRIGKQMKKSARVKFYKKVLPHLVDYHQWLYTERDPHGEGLTLQLHPYETGLDNTPPWMKQLHEHSKPLWIKTVEKLPMDWFVNIIRRDTRSLPPEQRMDNIDALMNWHIVKCLRRKHYDIDRMMHRSIFMIEDVSFNAIFIRNNTILREIAAEARIKLPNELTDRMKQSEKELEVLWDEQYGLYFSRDFGSHKLLRDPTIACLMPLYAGTIKPERAKKLVQVLMNTHAFNLKHPLPSVPRNVRGFSAQRYWQGPTWINMNWLIIDGLRRLGFAEEADLLKEKTLALVTENDIWEYYNPLTGEGLGSPDFTWTAALALDLAKS